MNDPLLDRLLALSIDPPGSRFSFERRLAHENGWSTDFARRVIREYFRFVWLAVRAGHPVTPSPAVDEAWHLHLSYSRSYWEDLCDRVLGRPLHHGPTRGGAAEAAKYARDYASTLASYRRYFGPPPPELWPAVEERFRFGIPRRVDARTHWVIEKRQVARLATAAAVVLSLSVLAGCTRLLARVDPLVVVGLIGLLVVAVVVAVVQAAHRSRGKDSGCGGGAGGGCSSGRHADHDADGGGDGGGGDGGGGGCGGGGCGD